MSDTDTTTAAYAAVSSDAGRVGAIVGFRHRTLLSDDADLKVRWADGTETWHDARTLVGRPAPAGAGA